MNILPIHALFISVLVATSFRIINLVEDIFSLKQFFEKLLGIQ